MPLSVPGRAVEFSERPGRTAGTIKGLTGPGRRLHSGEVSKSWEARSLSWELVQVVSAETTAINRSLQGEHQNPKLNSRTRGAEISRSQATRLAFPFWHKPPKPSIPPSLSAHF